MTARWSRPGGTRPPLGLRLFTIVLFVHWIVAGLDRGRFHWSDSVPAWLQALGLIAVAAGYALCFWAMAVNRFFSSVVRIQTDRGQHVITAGPYACVRHPGYLAGIVIMVASGPQQLAHLAQPGDLRLQGGRSRCFRSRCRLCHRDRFSRCPRNSRSVEVSGQLALLIL